MWETIVVLVIVILCLALAGRAFYREASGKSRCGGCGSGKQGCRGGCDGDGFAAMQTGPDRRGGSGCAGGAERGRYREGPVTSRRGLVAGFPVIPTDTGCPVFRRRWWWWGRGPG